MSKSCILCTASALQHADFVACIWFCGMHLGQNIPFYAVSGVCTVIWQPLVQTRTNSCSSGYTKVPMARMLMPCSADCRATGPAAFLSAVLNSMAVNLIMMQNAREVSSVILMLSYLFGCPMTQCHLVKSQIVPAVRPFKQVQRDVILCIATDVSPCILNMLQVAALASQITCSSAGSCAHLLQAI